ncbi:27625_t:CDS:1, partial [Racocetra persica]
ELLKWLSPKGKKSALWRFDKNCFKNKRLKKEVLDEILDIKNVEDWDFHKVQIQSIIRAFRKPRVTENKIAKLNKNITQLKERLAHNSENNHLLSQIDTLNSDLQEELA